MTPEQIRQVNATARSGGAVGSDPICYRFLIDKLAGTNAPVLDYGAGPEAVHTRRMRQHGIAAYAYDVGTNHAAKDMSPYQQCWWLPRNSILSGHFRLRYIVASNVLNVQPTHTALLRTIEELRDILRANKGAAVILNYPQKPRKCPDVSVKDLIYLLTGAFPGFARVPVGSSSYVFVCWELTSPAELLTQD